MQHGSLGPVAAGKAPLYLHGKLIGEVSVGFPVANVGTAWSGALPLLIGYLLGMLAVGVLAALALARRLKRQTFGLELSEIAALLQEREAMLHGIREAFLGYDTGGRVLLANDAARDLLGLPAEFAGRKLRYMLPPGRLHRRGDRRGDRQRPAGAARRPGARRQPDADHPQPPAARLGGDLPGPHRVRGAQALARRGDRPRRHAARPVARVREPAAYPGRPGRARPLRRGGRVRDRPVGRPGRADRPARRGDRRAEARRADPRQGVARRRA